MTDLEIAINQYEIENKKRLSQSKIARELKITPNAVNQVIRGKARSRRIEKYLDSILNNKN